METHTAASAARLAALSAREREVLDLAVEGRTDDEIGHALGITSSTVNSYWGRVRGKLGQLSRTELVGLVLRHESGLRYASLVAQHERLQKLHAEVLAEVAERGRTAASAEAAPWLAIAVDHLPDAVLVLNVSQAVVYANLQAEYAYECEPGGLVGAKARDLAAEPCRAELEATLTSLLDLGGPPRVALGIEAPHHAVRFGGGNFRAVFVGERFPGPNGPMVAVTVREYMADVEEMIRALRKPLIVG